ncbi:MAG: hypothetical protein ACT4QC_09115 [Planctomycetaceae bacterium]
MIDREKDIDGENVDELKMIFARQRDADGRREPNFRAAWARAIGEQNAPLATQRSVWNWPRGVAAVAAIALVAVAILWRHLLPTADRPAHVEPVASHDAVARQIDNALASLNRHVSAEQVFSWQPPTDALLNSTRFEAP